MFKQERFLFFALGLLTFICLEFFFAYRKRNFSRLNRWPANLLIIFIGTFVLKLSFPLGLSVVSDFSAQHGLGLLNHVSLPWFLSFAFTIIYLDFSIYIQHVLTHKISWLWRLHRVHHSDVDLDATSALRFHPLEILFSFFYKSLVVILIGASIESIIIFEILLNLTAIFNHSNLFIPKKWEVLLRKIIVTPQMHLVHHSVHQEYSDMNYGFNFSFWDRIFKTYEKELPKGSLIGNRRFRKSKDQNILELLKQPLL